MQRKRSRNAKPLRAVRVSNSRSRKGNPPQLSSNIRTIHKFRFISNAAFNDVITSKCCFGAAGGIGTVVNSTLSFCYESLRLLKVEAWSPPAAQGAAATVSVEWLSTNSPSIEVSDTTVSVSQNAHISSRPPQESLASFWQQIATTFTMFTLVCPANTIIDVTLELIQLDQAAVALTQTGLATVVVGEMYYLSLDRNRGTNILIPVSLTTTT
jgi:hypothetical protein